MKTVSGLVEVGKFIVVISPFGLHTEVSVTLVAPARPRGARPHIPRGRPTPHPQARRRTRSALRRAAQRPAEPARPPPRRSGGAMSANSVGFLLWARRRPTHLPHSAASGEPNPRRKGRRPPGVPVGGPVQQAVETLRAENPNRHPSRQDDEPCVHPSRQALTIPIRGGKIRALSVGAGRRCAAEPERAPREGRNRQARDPPAARRPAARATTLRAAAADALRRQAGLHARRLSPSMCGPPDPTRTRPGLRALSPSPSLSLPPQRPRVGAAALRGPRATLGGKGGGRGGNGLAVFGRDRGGP